MTLGADDVWEAQWVLLELDPIEDNEPKMDL
jgi:hypothetical protein